MKSKEVLIACAMALVCPAPAIAGGVDLSAFGTPVDQTVPAAPPPPNEPTNRHWPAHICAEIQRVEGIAVGGPLRPSDRGIARFGLLLLEQGHCGIDVSRKIAADQAVLDEEQRRASRDFDENMAAAAASRSQEPIIVQVPQAGPADPAPPRPLNCFATRFGGGISSTTCR
jgi:hypothetical protein